MQVRAIEEPVQAVIAVPTPEVQTPTVEAPIVQAPQTSSNTEEIVRQAARKYGLDENNFVRIAMCESTMNPNAVNYGYNENGNPSGLFQHLAGYYPARAAKYGYSTNVFDAYSNANTTAAMFADGQSYLWECK